MAKIQLKRSVILDGGNAKEPTASQMQYGEIAINYNEDDPSIFIKDSSDAIVRIAGVNARGNIPSDIQGYPDITDSQGATLDARYLKLGSGIGAQVVQSSSPTDFNGGLKVSGGSTYLLELASGGATKLVVLPTGQVGIGVTSPTAPLQVSGQVIASSFAGTGSALTSLDGGNISQGTINTARLPAIYTLASQIAIGATGSVGNLVLFADKNIGLTASDTGSYITLTANNGQGSYRFTKAGQTTIAGFLDFQSVTADRTYTYPNVSGTVALISSTIDNSDKLDGLHAASFIRSDALTEVTSNTEWQDSKKAMFGNDGDLQIYNDGTKSLIDNNTGDLLLRSNVDDDDGGNIVLQAKSGENSIICNDDGKVSLHFDGDIKFETKIGGTLTTGNSVSDQFQSTIANGTSPLIVASSTLVANLNADSLDGVQAASFLRSDQNTTFNASGPTFNFNSDGSRTLIEFQYNSTSKWNLRQNNNGLNLDFIKVGTHSGSIKIDGNLIWHAGNDGAGSGLDADTLDGNDSSNFIRSNVASNITNSMKFQDNVELQFGDSSDFKIFHNSSSNSNIIQNYRNSDGNILINGANSAGTTQTILIADSSTARTFVQLNENNAIRLKTTDIGATIYGSLKTTASQGTAPFIVLSTTKVVNLNADKLDGLESTSFLRSDAADSAAGELTFNGKVNIRGNIDLSDGEILYFGSSDDITISYNSNNWLFTDFKSSNGIIFQDNGVNILRLTDSGDIYPETTNTGNIGLSSRYWSKGFFNDIDVASVLNVRGAIDLADNDVVRLGTGDDAEIFHDGSNLYFKIYGNDDIIFQDANSGNAQRVRFDMSGGRIFCDDNLYAGRSMVAANIYKPGVHTIEVFGRNSDTHDATAATASASAGLMADYRGPGNEAASEDTAMIYGWQRNGSGSITYIHNLDVRGRAWHYGSIYAGRGRSSATGTATDYYNPSEMNVQAYAGVGGYYTYIAGRNVADNSNVFIANVASPKIKLQASGNGYFDGGADLGNADYAEMFEWKDGNPENEDRRGYSVCLDGEHIRVATTSDDPSEILGIVSAEPGVLGDSASLNWHGQYLRDEYGRKLRNPVEYLIWNAKDDTQPNPNNENDSPDSRIKISELGTGSPEDLEVPDYARTNNIRKVYYALVLNPDYDPTQNYVNRRNRKEWDAVGMLGKLALRKNQITGDRWRMLKVINDQLDLWLIR